MRTAGGLILVSTRGGVFRGEGGGLFEVRRQSKMKKLHATDTELIKNLNQDAKVVHTGIRE